MMIQDLSLNLSARLTGEQVLWELAALPSSIVVTELCFHSQLLCDSSESEPKPTCLHSKLFIFWAITPSPQNKKSYEFTKYINFMDSGKNSHLRQIIKLDKEYNYT